MDPTQQSDPFEDRYMAGGASVLHRSKRRSRFMAVSMLALALFTAIMGVLTRNPAVPFVPVMMFASTALFLFCGLGLSVIRTTVTAQEVHVQFGLWGPRVRIDAVESCRVVPYEMMKFGGWGIKRSLDGTWAYTLSPSDRVVELCWKAGGKEHKAVFNAEDPEAVVAAVMQARALATPDARRRIEAASNDPGPDEELVESARHRLPPRQR